MAGVRATNKKTDDRSVRSSGGPAAVRLDGVEARPVAVDQSAEPRRRRRTNRRGDEVREKIVEAALRCFGTFGFEGTSTRAVAELAEVTHSLVLYHFRSKEQLWISAMDSALSAYTSRIKEYLGAAKSGADGVRIFIEQFIRMSAEHPQIHRILTTEGNQGTSRLQWVIENYLREHFEMVRDLIRKGQQEGAVRQCDPARLYYMLLGSCGTLFTVSTEYRELTGRDVFSETEILRNIAMMYELVFVDAP